MKRRAEISFAVVLGLIGLGAWMMWRQPPKAPFDVPTVNGPSNSEVEEATRQLDRLADEATRDVQAARTRVAFLEAELDALAPGNDLPAQLAARARSAASSARARPRAGPACRRRRRG